MTDIRGNSGSRVGAFTSAAVALGLALADCAKAQSFQILKTFSYDTPEQGLNPYTQPIVIEGKLYGTTASGGSQYRGVIYRMDPDGANYEVLYDLTDSNDGANPRNPITYLNGWIYGSCQLLGQNNGGTLFRFNPSTLQFEAFHQFSGNGAGAGPRTDLVYDGSRYLYGGTTRGGSDSQKGVVFRYDLEESNYSVVYDLTNLEGALTPAGGFVLLDGVL